MLNNKQQKNNTSINANCYKKSLKELKVEQVGKRLRHSKENLLTLTSHTSKVTQKKYKKKA